MWVGKPTGMTTANGSGPGPSRSQSLHSFACHLLLPTLCSMQLICKDMTCLSPREVDEVQHRVHGAVDGPVVLHVHDHALAKHVRRYRSY